MPKGGGIERVEGIPNDWGKAGKHSGNEIPTGSKRAGHIAPEGATKRGAPENAEQGMLIYSRPVPA